MKVDMFIIKSKRLTNNKGIIKLKIQIRTLAINNNMIIFEKINFFFSFPVEISCHPLAGSMSLLSDSSPRLRTTGLLYFLLQAIIIILLD